MDVKVLKKPARPGSARPDPGGRQRERRRSIIGYEMYGHSILCYFHILHYYSDTPEEQQRFEKERVAEVLGTLRKSKSIAKKRAEKMARKLEVNIAFTQDSRSKRTCKHKACYEFHPRFCSLHNYRVVCRPIVIYYFQEDWRESQKKADVYDRSRKASFKVAREKAAQSPNIYERILDDLPKDKILRKPAR